LLGALVWTITQPLRSVSGRLLSTTSSFLDKWTELGSLCFQRYRRYINKPSVHNKQSVVRGTEDERSPARLVSVGYASYRKDLEEQERAERLSEAFWRLDGGTDDVMCGEARSRKLRLMGLDRRLRSGT
ncbi:hypothetical protein PHMEG_00028633, partial [Phytophthora megakarya]